MKNKSKLLAPLFAAALCLAATSTIRADDTCTTGAEDGLTPTPAGQVSPAPAPTNPNTTPAGNIPGGRWGGAAQAFIDWLHSLYN